MYEAFMLFESICNSKWFVNTSMILFLNKVDLFQEKMRRSEISEYFPDYLGNRVWSHSSFVSPLIKIEKFNRPWHWLPPS